jgi:hypothetical protein
MEPTRAGVDTGWRDRLESSAKCASLACHLREVVPFEGLSNHHAEHIAFLRYQAKRMGEAALTFIASLTPSLSWNP